ncbi:hypothetical protein NLP75_25155, partial [Escherichia coli]|nr:hypothetical protein [Escherichia coli]
VCAGLRRWVTSHDSLLSDGPNCAIPGSDLNQAEKTMLSKLTLDDALSYCLIVASATFAGVGTSSAWIGASVFMGLIALFKPSR